MKNQLITQDSIEETEDVDISKLRAKLATSLGILNTSMFDQAHFEFSRLERLRTTISTIEQELFTEESLQKMDSYERLQLYRLASDNLKVIMKFMQDLNKSSATTMESLAHIEKMNLDKNKSTESSVNDDSEQVRQIKTKIMSLITKKTEEL